MADIKKLAPKIAKWEGGFVNHKYDRGGATNKGVTMATFKQYRKANKLPVPSVDDLKNISDTEWMDVLKTYYWNRWRADEITNQSIANLLVDWLWGSGVYGIKYPQQVLGVVVDGIVGKKTLDAINNYLDQEELFYKLWNRRKQHFEGIVRNNPTQKVFLKGWLNRLNDFGYEKQ